MESAVLINEYQNIFEKRSLGEKDTMREKKQTGLVSVIVPIYNIENYLEECLDSLIHQSYRNLEIILVDDGSTDRSGEICDRYAKQDDRIKVIHKENGGLSSARNRGMDVVTGEFVSFIDGDDYIDCDTFQVCIDAMQERQAEVVEFGIVGRNTDEESVKGIFDREDVLKRAISSSYSYPSDSVWNKMYRKSLIENLSFPEGKIHEDSVFLAQVFAKEKKYYFINRQLYFYRCREDSITHTKFSVRDLDKLELYKERTRYLRQCGYKEAVELSVAEEFIVLFSLYWKTAVNCIPEAKMLRQEIIERKREFRKSRIPWKRKSVYALFYVHPKCYLLVRDVIERFLV